MAKATLSTKTVQKIVHVEEVSGITLDLSLDELMTLMTILDRVGGHTSKSPRKHALSISNAIEFATEHLDLDAEKLEKIRNSVEYERNSIYFKDLV